MKTKITLIVFIFLHTLVIPYFFPTEKNIVKAKPFEWVELSQAFQIEPTQKSGNTDKSNKQQTQSFIIINPEKKLRIIKYTNSSSNADCFSYSNLILIPSLKSYVSSHL